MSDAGARPQPHIRWMTAIPAISAISESRSSANCVLPRAILADIRGARKCLLAMSVFIFLRHLRQ